MNNLPPRRTYTAVEIADRFLQHVAVGHQYLTPDFTQGSIFTAEETGSNFYAIRTESGLSRLSIDLERVQAAYQFLLDNNVGPNNPIEIRSSDDPDTAGPLCRATRQGPHRTINYILPILADMGVVGLNGQTQPNTVWLAPRNRVAPTPTMEASVE